MPDPIQIRKDLVIPAAAQTVRAVRASGPGGQNVNKVATKIELRIDLDQIAGLDEDSRDTLRRRLVRKLDRSGHILVTSQKTRDQRRNLDDAQRKAAEWIRHALVPKKKRISTKPGRGSRERRLREKKLRSGLKNTRRSVDHEDT